MEREISALERARLDHVPGVPPVLGRGIRALDIRPAAGGPVPPDPTIRERFPHIAGAPSLEVVAGSGPADVRPRTVGVLLSGGQAPGGHNVIIGILDALRELDPASRLIGFRGGPRGVLVSDWVELDPARVAPYRNTGGFDMIGSGRDKLGTPEQLATCAGVCGELGLDGLVIVGGDDSNTNAAVLAESFEDAAVPTRVVGVPKTIDGDLRGGPIEMSFGFHTATRVYSELIGNVCRDALSARKYWHFIRLMGRSASHVTLECALETRPNVALIGEEVRRRGMTLQQVVDRVAGAVARRSAAGKEFGVCLVPEGLIEFIPEMRTLIDELNATLGRGSVAVDEQKIVASMSPAVAEVFRALPARIREQLLLDRDSHGNVRVSQIDTEQLLLERVATRLVEWREAGRFDGSFRHQAHFFGYEGRCAAPSNFDAAYTTSLGRLAAALVAFGHTGYLAGIRHLAQPVSGWSPLGVPLTSLMQIEMRKGRPTPVIAKALVEPDGAPFRTFVAARDDWERDEAYVYPGPLQYFGPAELTDRPPRTLELERGEARR